jgi:hypothetical protein
MIEHPYARRPAMQHDYYKSKEDQLLREVRDRAELLEEVRTLKRIMAAIASHLGASWR